MALRNSSYIFLFFIVLKRTRCRNVCRSSAHSTESSVAMIVAALGFQDVITFEIGEERVRERERRDRYTEGKRELETKFVTR